MAFSEADALQLVATGKATYYLGDHKVRATCDKSRGERRMLVCLFVLYEYAHVIFTTLLSV